MFARRSATSVAAAVTLLILCASAARSAEGATAPIVPAVKAPTPPVIDGRLDDEVWTLSPQAAGFWHASVPGRRASQMTTVHMLYDDAHLYFGFDCQDASPAEIKADQRKRGGPIQRDDHVGVDVDVLNTHTESYGFQVSANGTQNSYIPGGAASQIEWRGDWHAAAATNDRGWQAEMAIPLQNLRYLPGTTTFGLCFTRYLARKRETSVWPNLLDPGYDNELAADWVGLDLPAPRRPLVAMPYLLTDACEGEGGVLVAGLDLKHDFANGLTALAAFKPDFRTVEDAVESVDFTYTERALPERRPFFSEGAAAFYPPRLIFYSRRIGEIDAGLKAFGRANGVSLGLLATAKSGETHDIVLHTALKPTSKRTWWGGLSHHEGGDDPINTALCAGFSSWGPVGDGYRSFDGRVFWSQTAGPGGDDAAYSVSAVRRWRRERRRLAFSLQRVGADFESVLGLVPEQGIHEARVSATLQSRLGDDDNPPLAFSFTAASGGSTEGRRSEIGGSCTRRLTRDLRLTGRLDAGERDGSTERTAGLTLVSQPFDPMRKGKAAVRFGKRRGDGYVYASLSQRLRPNSRLNLDLSMEHLRLEKSEGPERRTQIVLTATYDLTHEKALSGRVSLRDGRVNLYLAYRQALRSGPDVFALLGDPNADGTTARFAAKVVWPFLL